MNKIVTILTGVIFALALFVPLAVAGTSGSTSTEVRLFGHTSGYDFDNPLTSPYDIQGVKIKIKEGDSGPFQDNFREPTSDYQTWLPAGRKYDVTFRKSNHEPKAYQIGITTLETEHPQDVTLFKINKN